MKQEIEEFQKENGNVNYTTKELLYAVHKKIDRLNEKVHGNEGRFSKLEINQKLDRKLIFGLYALGSTIIGGTAIAIFTRLL